MAELKVTVVTPELSIEVDMKDQDKSISGLSNELVVVLNRIDPQTFPVGLND